MDTYCQISVHPVINKFKETKKDIDNNRDSVIELAIDLINSGALKTKKTTPSFPIK
jgi:hypothetical protein